MARSRMSRSSDAWICRPQWHGPAGNQAAAVVDDVTDGAPRAGETSTECAEVISQIAASSTPPTTSRRPPAPAHPTPPGTRSTPCSAAPFTSAVAVAAVRPADRPLPGHLHRQHLEHRLHRDITVKNTGNSSVNGWPLTWTWLGNPQVTNAWNATITHSGTPRSTPAVPVKPATTAQWWPETVPTLDSRPSTAAPTPRRPGFALNGTTCTTA
jgi:endoglucanase